MAKHYVRTLLLLAIILIPILGQPGLAKATSDNIKEYGIVILPDNNCTQIASRLNNNLAQLLPDLKNVANHWHVTLYHGAFHKNDIVHLYKKLHSLKLKFIILAFTDIYTKYNRWIDWGIEKTDDLQDLHNEVVSLASPYHQKPLDRVIDIYHELSTEKCKQVDEYGVSGILELYTPHMTLFYQYPQNQLLIPAAKAIAKSEQTKHTCAGSKIAIGILGYNGNLEKIIYTIDLPQN